MIGTIDTHYLWFIQARLSVVAVGNIVGIQAQEIAKVTEKYATMSISQPEVNLFQF